LSAFFLMVHALIFLFSTIAGITLLAISNIGSMALYVLLLFLINKNKLEIAFYGMGIEILYHTLAVNFILDNDLHFTLYLIVIVPLSFLFLYLAQVKYYIPKSILCSVIALAAYMYCEYILKPGSSLYSIQVTNSMNTIFGLFNLTLVFFGLISFCAIFISAINRSLDFFTSENKALDNMANHDTLTGLRNRRSFEEKIERTIKNSESSGSAFCFLLIDIDDFKKVNDTYGHDNGDIVLKDIASILKKMTRPNDSLYRWGGEEFVIILSNIDKKNAANVSERIRAKIEKYEFKLSETTINCTVTIGAAMYKPGESYDELFKTADTKMYEGKQNGKNQVVF